MTDTVRYPLVLGLISLCSAASLAFSYALTRDEIRRQQQLDKDRGLAAVFGMEFNEKDKERPWQEVPGPGQEAGAGQPVFAATEPTTGRALYAATGSARGYSSRVEIIVAVDQGVKDSSPAAKIKAISVVAQSETPGLGDKCRAPEFQKQFSDLLLGRLELKKGVPYRVPGQADGDQQDIAAITGATITSNAVLSAVRQAIERIRERAAQAAGGGPAESRKP
ncbi:MAG TPA: FMN-binding protein [Planctomycetota bacterium]|nr:FMN-binding protein [Planctomycetota bacterium]